jgi:uncharacterized protein HemY
MKQDRTFKRTLMFLGVLAIALTTALTASAGPGKKNKGLKAMLQTHMKLAEFYMLDGQYAKAQEHFEAIIVAQLPTKKKTKGPGAEVFGDDGMKGNKRGGKGKRLAKARVRAYIGAAVAAHRQGNEDEAEAFAEAGIEWAQARGAKKGIKIFERFLDDPDTVADRAAPSVKELNNRLDAIKKAMDK